MVNHFIRFQRIFTPVHLFKTYLMKTAKELITVRFNHKHTTKQGTMQVLFELRNFHPDHPIIRINCLNSGREIIHLKPEQLKKGIVVDSKDGELLNAYFNKLRNRIRLSIDFLKFFNLPLSKQNIESYTYFKWSDVYHFYENVEDADDAKQYIMDHFIKSESDHQQEILDHEQLVKDINQYSLDNKLDYDRPVAILEAIDFFKWDNVNNTKIVAALRRYAQSKGLKDVLVEKFNADMFDDFITYITKKPFSIKDGVEKYYTISTVRSTVKMMKILYKNFKKEGYSIDPAIFDTELRIGKRKNSHIAYNFSETEKVIAINYIELQAIKNGNYVEKLPKIQFDILEKTRKLFLIQTLLGGLRIGELKLITKDSFFKMNNKTYLNLKSPKTSKTIDSPLHDELEPLLQSIKYDVDSLIFFKNSNGNYNDDKYNVSIRKMAKALGLNREVNDKKPTVNLDHIVPNIKKLHEVITSKFARKALVTLLFNLGYTIEQISSITNHSSESIRNYIAILMDDTS